MKASKHELLRIWSYLIIFMAFAQYKWLNYYQHHGLHSYSPRRITYFTAFHNPHQHTVDTMTRFEHYQSSLKKKAVRNKNHCLFYVLYAILTHVSRTFSRKLETWRTDWGVTYGTFSGASHIRMSHDTTVTFSPHSSSFNASSLEADWFTAWIPLSHVHISNDPF